MDKICIKQLVTPTLVGVFDRERKEKQNVWFDLELSLDIAQAIATDDIQDAVSYADVATAVVDYVSQATFQLIEALAEAVAQFILEKFSVKHVKLSLYKKPFDMPYVERVAVVIERTSHKSLVV